MHLWEGRHLTVKSASQSNGMLCTGRKEVSVLRVFLKKWLTSIFVFRNPFKICEYGKICRILEAQRSGPLLALGCGEGVQAILLSRRFRMTIGVDISEPVLRRAQER